jgi:hypothetical protein
MPIAALPSSYTTRPERTEPGDKVMTFEIVLPACITKGVALDELPILLVVPALSGDALWSVSNRYPGKTTEMMYWPAGIPSKENVPFKPLRSLAL